MFKPLKGLALCLALLSMPSVAIEDAVSETDIKAQLTAIQSTKATDANAEMDLLAKNLEGTLLFLEQAKKQQSDIDNLDNQVKAIPSKIKEYQANIAKLKSEVEASQKAQFEALSIIDLELKQNEILQQLQEIQAKISEINSSLVNGRGALERTQQAISNNNQRLQQIVRLSYSSQASKSLKDKFKAESSYLELNNKYNLLLSQHNDEIISLDEVKKTEANLKQQLLQLQLTTLQSILNDKRLKESEEKAQQAESLKESNKVVNPIIQAELNINADMSKFLLDQTQSLNKLSNDNLRIQAVLDSLTQTQRTIEEQISALQGTLVLSRVINQQKQVLPTDQLIQGLAKNITDLRVYIFESTQKRDELYNVTDYIAKVEQQNKIDLTTKEREALDNILQERKKMLSEILKSLNSQLNLSLNIEANQKQVVLISDTLQSKLQQQSFWVKSNNPIDLEWAENFPKFAINEIAELTKYIGFENIQDNLKSSIAITIFLLLVYALIIWKKSAIKTRLQEIALQVNTLKSDSQWHTPEAMFWTIVLALPSTLLFLAIFTIMVTLFFSDPVAGLAWGAKVSGYWLFFATVLSLLRPNGLAYRHFGMPQASNEIFQRIVKQSVWIVVLLVISSIFSQIDIIGFTNDVIGQVMTIVALALCLFVVRPLLDRGMREYENAKTEDGKKRSVSLLKLLRLVLFIAPITLIVLIVLGYYYTAVYLIEHILNSYFVALVWVFGRYFAYRFLTISSRRMAYRRLQEKRKKIREQASDPKEESKEEENIKISTVNAQIFRVADLIGWVVLFASLYAIWSDLISVAYYLEGVILWEQVETTSKGTMVESITLLNLMRSLSYLVITYVLVKNIAGILEVTFFSRIRLSKGTPHTITAVLTYIIATFGIISSFTSLGVSWSKIQWVFTALSVGLGFGVREIFGSFVSGTILLFERPIRVGDKVTVGQYSGVISRIRLRSTTLIDDENKEVVLPNQAFVTDRFINWTLNNTITRLQILIKIYADSDLKLVRQLLLQAAGESPKVMADPEPSVNLLQFGDGWIEHELTVYVPELNDRGITRNFLYYRINQLFQEHYIKLVFDQLDVHLHNPISTH